MAFMGHLISLASPLFGQDKHQCFALCVMTMPNGQIYDGIMTKKNSALLALYKGPERAWCFLCGWSERAVKQSSCLWCEMPWYSCNANVMFDAQQPRNKGRSLMGTASSWTHSLLSLHQIHATKHTIPWHKWSVYRHNKSAKALVSEALLRPVSLRLKMS